MRTQLTNATHYDTGARVDLTIEEGIIVTQPSGSADVHIDAAGLVLIPGVIDAHVHSRMPGDGKKEDWHSLTKAALAGGVTTVLDMPNTTPPIATTKQVKEKISAAANDAGIDVGVYIAALNDNAAEVIASDHLACGVKIYYGASTGNIVMNDPAVLRQLLDAHLTMPLVIHAESDHCIEATTAKNRDYQGSDIHQRVRPKKAAVEALTEILELTRDYPKAPIHITHMSTADELNLVRHAKQNGRNISCDVTPHHLAFTADDHKRLGNFLRVNPPIRDQSDVTALWAGIADGTIDMIATDHAPHLKSEKQQDYWDVPSGIPGVQTILPFLLDHRSDSFTLSDIVRLVCSAPAERFLLRSKGSLAPGSVGDVVLLDLNGSTQITTATQYSKAGWTPWDGQTFKGAIKRVLRRGVDVTIH